MRYLIGNWEPRRRTTFYFQFHCFGLHIHSRPLTDQKLSFTSHSFISTSTSLFLLHSLTPILGHHVNTTRLFPPPFTPTPAKAAEPQSHFPGSHQSYRRIILHLLCSTAFIRPCSNSTSHRRTRTRRQHASFTSTRQRRSPTIIQTLSSTFGCIKKDRRSQPSSSHIGRIPRTSCSSCFRSSTATEHDSALNRPKQAY